MDIGIKRTQRDYTLAFKLSVIEQVEQGGEGVPYFV
jgi:transposase-like protein